MNFDAIRGAITAHFQANFTKPAPTPENQAATEAFIPTAWENRTFKQPSGKTWCRFAVRFGERHSASVGRDHKRMHGLVYIQVFVEENGGTKPLYDATTKASPIFDDVTLAAGDGAILQFETLSMDPVGKTGDGWHQANLVVPFHVDKVGQAGEWVIDGHMKI